MSTTQQQINRPQALVDAIARQRDLAMNNLAQAEAHLVVLGAEHQRVMAERDELRKRVAELEPKNNVEPTEQP